MRSIYVDASTQTGILPPLPIKNAEHSFSSQIPFLFAGYAFVFSLSLYFAPIFDDVPGSKDPELIVIYITTSFLVIAVLPFLFKPFTEGHDPWEKHAVILITVLGALHTAIVGVGYVLVERDRPQPLGACVVPGLVYLSERWGDERKRNRKEN